MENNYKQTKLNRYPISYNIETVSTPLKPNQLRNKEIILNSFLQETYNQKKSKAKANLLYDKMAEESNSDIIYLNMLKKNKEKININNYNDKFTSKNGIPISSLYQKKYKTKIEIQDNNSHNFQMINKNTRNTSNKSSVIPSSENQITSLINSRNIETKNDVSFFQNFDSNNKIKRHKTVYIKKNLSVERNLNSNKNRNKNISQDDRNIKYYHSNKKTGQKYCTSSTMRKQNKNISNKSNTNNINSNVNIFNFGMQYSNAPHFFIKNSKMFHPYFNDYFPYNNQNINYNVNQYEILKESAILIQSVFRGGLVRVHINNLLIVYKKFEFLHLFLKNKFWKIFKKKLFLNQNKINHESDSKLSISSISGFSALANSNFNKKAHNNNYNLKLFKESKEAFSILNNNNNKNEISEERNLISFEKYNMENNKNQKIIWNKKITNNNNSILSNIIGQKLFSKNIKKINIEKKDSSLNKDKDKYLKIIITKKAHKERLLLQKFFLRFYYNGKLYNIKNMNNTNNNEIKIDIKDLIQKKLKKIIENRHSYHFSVLFKYFSKFKFKGILNYIQAHQYLIINGGRLKNLEEDPFFIYEFSKNKIKTKETKRNIKSILIKIKKLRKIIYNKKQDKIEIVQKYFNKFRIAGIRYYMQIELKKKIMIKNLILKANKENFIPKIENKNDIESKKYKTLNKLILKYNNHYINCCKNIFDRWNLRTKLFSLITKDKEKKKKRRIKKRYNKKLAANINNINNNILNKDHINEINNKNKINNFSCDSNSKINIKSSKNELNYDMGHPDSIIFINNVKITDYFKLTKFISKISGVLTKKFYFFKYIINKTKKEEDPKNNINNDVDFFMDDSSESEDQ